MQNQLYIYNTLSRKKELFEPINAPFVGMYVCGPTVYGDAHLGHARSAISFDIVFRYLKFSGYKVRYVRNITDVGHLENDADEGEDKIAKKAKLEQLEPMEVANYYKNNYHEDMAKLNVLPPSIEPLASGHIVEQIIMIQSLIDKGMAYESCGSVYFNVNKYAESNEYGELSGRKIDELLNTTRELDGQSEKQSSLDFALWKKASPEHIMRWPSPWSDGFPGWHIECSAMSKKYLGDYFDIHGGGMDLLFPHHESEIAQSKACNHSKPAKYWMHNNMITINGQKMGKSLGNFITLGELFSGNHTLLERAYSPMTIRFFILQAQYRSTLDFSNEALQAAQKGYLKVMNGLRILKNLTYVNDSSAFDEKTDTELKKLTEDLLLGMNDDINTAMTIAALFNLLKKINSFYTAPISVSKISENTFISMKKMYIEIVEDVLGLNEESSVNVNQLVESFLEFYKEAKEQKDYAKIDVIRASLKLQGIVLKDMKDRIDWAYDEV
jgi:cysteinyl-tRNA synthetase